MADPILVKRLAQRLQEASEATPKGEGFWPALATLAADEAVRVVSVQQQVLPVNLFVAAYQRREGLRFIASAATLAEVNQVAVTFLQETGVSDRVWIMEIRRVLGSV